MANKCKYYKEKQQVSYDFGVTWLDTGDYRKGSLIEYQSSDCQEPSFDEQYLTFITSDDITVTFTPENSNEVYYSKDSGSTWTQGNTIAMDAGDEVMLKGNMTPNTNGIGRFSSTGQFTVQGNAMSLLYGDNFEGQTDLSGKNNAFRNLFSGCTYLQSIDDLVLPATTLSSMCYRSMFQSCTSLTTAPSNLLPATTLEGDCYRSMFQSCTSLTTAPELPATTLEINCYRNMFQSCTSLTTAPVLSAATLATSCCLSMFQSCTSLTTAPTLSATTLATSCYRNMFSGCTNLNSITCLATDISASNCTTNWVNGVAASGTFIRDCNTVWSTGVNGIPNNWQDNCTPPPLSAQYLTFIASDDITVTFTPQNSNVLYYSKDSGSTWTQGNTIAMDAGDEVMLKGTMTSSYVGIGKFSSNGSFEALGNPMSLLFGDNFSGQTSLSGKNYAFMELFRGCAYLQSIENLVLPATTLASNCYYYMFYGCSSLASVPSGLLPATTLANNCYRNMFQSCTSLTNVPQLPATTLTSSCYASMFASCTSLTTVPSGLLPATTLAEACYYQMFNGCSSLTSVPQLPATTLTSSCYYGMFASCTSLTTVPTDLLSATTLADDCCFEMFYGCTALTTAPDLLATTLAEGCYLRMFASCNLNYIKCLATDISASNCTTNWVNGVAASGTFTKAASMSSWGTGPNGIPDGWTVQDAS